MPRPIVEMTGNQLVGFITKKKPYDDPDAYEGKYFFSEFYYQGSAMRQARRMQRMAANNPNEEPIPFVMPSARFLDTYSQPFIVGQPPTYTITGHTGLGGSIDYDSGIASFLEIKNGITISDTTFEDNVNISLIDSNYEITFNNCKFEKGINISNSKFKKLISLIATRHLSASII